MKQFVFSLFLIILISTASAQVYDYFDLTRGNLPDSTVISLTIKSPNEFIIGTNNGYSYVKGNSLEICSTLKSNRIKDIEFGTNGILWIATDIGLIKKEGNKQTLYDKTNSDLKTNNIRCLQLNNGDLWLGTYSGLYKYDGKDFSCFNTSNSHLPSDTIREILIDTNERVLVLSRRHLSFIDKYNQISSIKAPDNSLFSRMIVENDTVIISSYHKAFTIVNDSTLILNYSDNNPTDRINGVCNLSGKMHTFSSTKRIINTTNRNSVQLITSSLIDQIDYISLIKTDSSGNYYIGTPNKGLIIIEASKKKLKV